MVNKYKKWHENIKTWTIFHLLRYLYLTWCYVSVRNILDVAQLTYLQPLANIPKCKFCSKFEKYYELIRLSFLLKVYIVCLKRYIFKSAFKIFHSKGTLNYRNSVKCDDILLTWMMILCLVKSLRNLSIYEHIWMVG